MSYNGKNLKDAFLSGVASLTNNKDYINELNVFPVPDGDTGTNMSMTLEMAVKTVNSLIDDNLHDVCKAVQQGSLRGARGNSGVIMSQILRGFTNFVKDEKELNIHLIMDGIDKAREQAYKSVIKPKEGTILTVIKALAEEAKKYSNIDTDDIKEIFEKIVDAGDAALKNTPNLLPILKEAGVVDSGGQGLMCFFHGVLSYIKGEKVDMDLLSTEGAVSNNINLQVEEDQDIKYGYCTECMINNTKGFPDDIEETLTKYLGDPSFGDSLVLVADESLIKIHVHTNHPGKVFEKGLEYGFLTNLKVDNLKLEHQEKLIKDASKKAKENSNVKKEPAKEYGFIAVSSGDGLTDIMNDLNIDFVIKGGQTMNPSTDDFINAIDKVNAKNIFIFPNNGNIIMAAKQAASIIEDKKIYVVETKNVLQGINCMIYYTEGDNAESMMDSFKETISHMKTIENTYAVRDTTIDGIDIVKDNYLSLGDNGLLSTDKNRNVCILDAYAKIKTDDDSVISIYYGKDVSKDEAESLKKDIVDKYDNVDVEIYNGGQPVYYYYISVE